MHNDTRQLVDEKEAAAILRVSARWLQERRLCGTGPPYVRLSKKLIRYDPRALLRWAEQKTVEAEATGEVRS
jgi:hypothetical protein